VLLAAAAIGCGHGPVPAKTARPAAVAASTGADAGAAEAPSVVLPPIVAPRWRREDGCARDWVPCGDPSKDVVALGRICTQGTTPILPEPSVVRVAAGRSAKVPFALTAAPACLYAAAAAGSGGISLSLRDPADKPLSSLSSTDSAVLVPPDGPVCVRAAGSYQVLVNVPAANASSAEITVAVQIWRTAAD
jgi:hypothetical protein